MCLRHPKASRSRALFHRSARRRGAAGRWGRRLDGRYRGSGRWRGGRAGAGVTATGPAGVGVGGGAAPGCDGVRGLQASGGARGNGGAGGAGEPERRPGERGAMAPRTALRTGALSPRSRSRQTIQRVVGKADSAGAGDWTREASGAGLLEWPRGAACAHCRPPSPCSWNQARRDDGAGSWRPLRRRQRGCGYGARACRLSWAHGGAPQHTAKPPPPPPPLAARCWCESLGGRQGGACWGCVCAVRCWFRGGGLHRGGAAARGAAEEHHRGPPSFAQPGGNAPGGWGGGGLLGVRCVRGRGSAMGRNTSRSPPPALLGTVQLMRLANSR